MEKYAVSEKLPEWFEIKISIANIYLKTIDHEEKKMKYLFFIFLLLFSIILFSQDIETNSMEEVYVSQIMELKTDSILVNYILEVEEKVERSGFITREFSLSYGTIPGIGQPFSKMIVHFEQESTEDHELIEIPVVIENYYQFAGNISYEMYIFDSLENVVYCLGKCGFGSIENVDNIEWRFYDSYVFVENKLIWCTSGKGILDLLADAVQSKADRRIEQAYMLLEIIDNANIPRPAVFDEYYFGE